MYVHTYRHISWRIYFTHGLFCHFFYELKTVSSSAFRALNSCQHLKFIQVLTLQSNHLFFLFFFFWFSCVCNKCIAHIFACCMVSMMCVSKIKFNAIVCCVPNKHAFHVSVRQRNLYSTNTKQTKRKKIHINEGTNGYTTNLFVNAKLSQACYTHVIYNTTTDDDDNVKFNVIWLHFF